MKNEKMKKVLKIVKTVLNVVVGLFVILFLLVVCLQRFTNNKLSFFDYRMFTVVSGSMMPDYEIGDVLFSKEVQPDDIKVGDDISYFGKSGDVKDKVVTHRVTEIEKDENGNLLFHTQGTANIIEDPIVYSDQIYGKVIYKTTILSFISKTIRTPIGLVIFVIVPVFYVIGSEMLTTLLNKEEERRKSRK